MTFLAHLKKVDAAGAASVNDRRAPSYPQSVDSRPMDRPGGVLPVRTAGVTSRRDRKTKLGNKILREAGVQGAGERVARRVREADRRLLPTPVTSPDLPVERSPAPRRGRSSYPKWVISSSLDFCPSLVLRSKQPKKRVRLTTIAHAHLRESP